MISVAEIRAIALEMPEACEATHFNLPAFKVRDKVFVVIQKGETHAILSVDEKAARAAEAEDFRTYEVVRRNGGRIFVGVRAELASASRSRIKELVELAWRHKAPRKLASGSRP